MIDVRSGSAYVSNSRPLAMLIKERTVVESYIIPRVLSSTMRFKLFSSIYKSVLFHTVAKSMVDNVKVIRTIKTVILFRNTKFMGIVRSLKLFLKSLTIRLKPIVVVLDAADDTEA